MAGAKIIPVQTEMQQHISLGQAKHTLRQTQRACSELGKEARDSAPKRSSWARAWRMREAPIRELMEAEMDVA